MMENERELGDILIHDDETMKSAQSKKMILVAAAAVVLFLMVIFSIYALTREEEQPVQIPLSAPQKVDSAIPLPTAPSMPDTHAEESKFHQVPLADKNLNSDDKFEQIVRELKAQATQNALPTPPTEPSATPPHSEPVINEAPPLKQIAKERAMPSPKESKPQPKRASDAFKNIEATDTPKVKSKSHGGNFYLQVGSFSKFSAESSFAKKIKNEGFSFITQREKVNGSEITRVLVGPYKSRSEAANALKDVKVKIEPKAFIKQF